MIAAVLSMWASPAGTLWVCVLLHMYSWRSHECRAVLLMKAAKDAAWWDDAANQAKNKAELASLLELKAELEKAEARWLMT